MCPDRGVYFDLFGWPDGDIDHVRDAVEKALGIDLEPHESSYWGVYYRSGLPGVENFELRRNRDAENELTEPEHSSFHTLLFVNQTDRPGDIAEALAKIKGATRLRSEEFPR
jgi:hypothetical protein